MNTYTHTQLLQALAKLLPEIEYKQHELYYKYGNMRMIGDTELLHLCWLVEERLNPSVESEIVSDEPNIWRDYVKSLDALCCKNGGQTCMHATWQQRTIALAQTLGVEIV